MSLPAAVVGSTPGPRVRLVHEAGLAAILLMEVVWLVPWFRSLTPVLNQVTTLGCSLLLLGIAFLASLIGRGLRTLQMRSSVRAVVLLGLLFLSIAISLRLVLFRDAEQGTLSILAQSVSTFTGVLTLVPNELIVILAVLYAWRRGVIASVRDPLDPAGTAHAFRLGILAFVVHALIYRNEHSRLLVEALPLFFGAALTGIGLARADRLSAARGGGRSPFTGRWLAALLLVTVATTGLGVVIGVGLQTPAASGLADATAEGLRRAAEAVLVALTPLAVAAGALIEIVFRLLREWLGVDLAMPDLSVLRRPEPPPMPEPGPAPAWLVTYGPTLRVAGTLAVLLAIALAALRTTRRGPARGLQPFQDQVEPIPAGASAESRKGGLAEILGGRSLRRRFLAAQTVRRLYQRLLRLGEARGAHRHTSKTPYEFIEDLLRVFPDHGSEVRALTEAYVRVRYGELPEDEQEVRLLRACLAALSGAGKDR